MIVIHVAMIVAGGRSDNFVQVDGQHLQRVASDTYYNINRMG